MRLKGPHGPERRESDRQGTAQGFSLSSPRTTALALVDRLLGLCLYVLLPNPVLSLKAVTVLPKVEMLFFSSTPKHSHLHFWPNLETSGEPRGTQYRKLVRSIPIGGRC